jgi:hypothetical protein
MRPALDRRHLLEAQRAAVRGEDVKVDELAEHLVGPGHLGGAPEDLRGKLVVGAHKALVAADRWYGGAERHRSRPHHGVAALHVRQPVRQALDRPRTKRAVALRLKAERVHHRSAAAVLGHDVRELLPEDCPGPDASERTLQRPGAPMENRHTKTIRDQKREGRLTARGRGGQWNLGFSGSRATFCTTLNSSRRTSFASLASARTGHRRVALLSTPRAHTQTPDSTNVLWETPRLCARGPRPEGRARTDGRHELLECGLHGRAHGVGLRRRRRGRREVLLVGLPAAVLGG